MCRSWDTPFAFISHLQQPLDLCVENISPQLIWKRACTLLSGMRATEAYVEGEQSLEVRIRGKGTRETQDVFSRCRPSFYRTAYRQLNNAADAEDAVQDALLSAYKHLDQFKGQAQMSTWLTMIVMNCA